MNESFLAIEKKEASSPVKAAVRFLSRVRISIRLVVTLAVWAPKYQFGLKRLLKYDPKISSSCARKVLLSDQFLARNSNSSA